MKGSPALTSLVKLSSGKINILYKETKRDWTCPRPYGRDLSPPPISTWAFRELRRFAVETFPPIHLPVRPLHTLRPAMQLRTSGCLRRRRGVVFGCHSPFLVTVPTLSYLPPRPCWVQNIKRYELEECQIFCTNNSRKWRLDLCQIVRRSIYCHTDLIHEKNNANFFLFYIQVLVKGRMTDWALTACPENDFPRLILPTLANY